MNVDSPLETNSQEYRGNRHTWSTSRENERLLLVPNGF